MRFCNGCGTYLREMKGGLWCPKCKKLIPRNGVVVPRGVERSDLTAIHVVDSSKADYVKVSRMCPKCGNSEAYRRFSRISGEHAGVRRERTVEHFTCTKCSHSWAKTS